MLRILVITFTALVALGLIANATVTVDPRDSQTGEVTEAADTLTFKTTFDPWPIEGLGRNVRLELVSDAKTLATFPIDEQGVVSVDLRSLEPPLRPVRITAEGCGVHVDAYSPPDLEFSWIDFRLANDEGPLKGVVFGKPDRGFFVTQGATTFAILIMSAPGSVEGVFKCQDLEAPANLVLRKGVNYLNLEAVNYTFLPANLEFIASQELAYSDPVVVDLATY